MIENMIKKAKEFLPLKILHAEWDGTSLHIYGVEWNFNTLSAWRISTADKVLFGCYDSDANQLVLNLKNLDVVDVKFQESVLKIDPVFILSNGQNLEIFSTDTFEPWIFQLGEDLFYVPTPSDPSAFLLL